LRSQHRIRTTTLLVHLCRVAMHVKNRAFPLVFVIATLAYQLSWVIRDLDPIDCP
jgi:hypothetical protein